MKRTGIGTAALVTLATLFGTPDAEAIDHAKGHAGFCRTAEGVTVVIDFQELGGPTIVRCDPRRNPGTGLDALKGAGFQIAGVQRWGEAFVCRIENRPAASETIPVAGNTGYRENCVDTPPASAYWSYWHAGNNCPWTYSQWGLKNRDATRGGFEGWSFSLNATADSNPVPRIAPVRPGTEGRPCDGTDEPGPSTKDPDERLDPGGGTGSPRGSAPVRRRHDSRDGSGGAPDSGAGRSNADPLDDSDRPDTTTGSPASDGKADSAGAPSSARPDHDGDPSAKRRAAGGAGVDPAANVEYTGGADAEDVRGVLRDESGANPIAPWVALAGIIGLAGVAGWMEGRRRRRRTS